MTGRYELRVSAVLLSCALAWSVMLVVLTFVLPVYTIDNGKVGWQPRVTLADRFGPSSLWPSLIAVAIVLACAALLLLLARSMPKSAIIAARVLAALTLVAGMTSVLFFHAPGLLLPPVGLLLVIASFTMPTRPARVH